MKVIEIFGSIDGEGKRTGQLATFIRLAGCNLRCIYCDTKYSFDVKNAKDMYIDDIIAECKKIGYHNVTLTGGEPLMNKDESLLLISCLCAEGFEVNVETNGSIDLTPFVKVREAIGYNFFLTVDYKCKYSGMNHLMKKESFEGLTDKDIVKCVVASEDDMDDALKYLDSFNKKFNIWFSPVFGKIEPVKIVDYMKKHNRQDITCQIQLHKIIWDPEKRGV